jgi:hypothetical protein
MSEKDNNVMPLATDPHNLGEFDNVYDAMRRYPNGGVDGDYIYILGVQHFWNVNRQSWGILKDKEDNLVQMVEDFIGLFERRGYVFAGYALPDTTPVSGLDNIFYIAAKNGIYTHFGSDLKLLNEVAILRKPRRSSIWIKDSMDIPNSERIDVIDDAISRINVDIETIKSAIIGMENDLDGVHDSIDDINKDIDAFKKETSENFEEVNSDLDKVEKRLDYIPKESFLSARPAGFKPDIDLTPEITVDRAWRDHEGNVIRDTYITRRGLRNEIIDITNQQVTDLKPGSVDPDDLSEATKQLIGNKSITNLPDEEDITVTDNQTLKLKDKEYAPKDYSGMGRVYLRKHYVNGVNTLTQHMMRKPNTIYIIQYDYCLAGQTIEVPENCVLKFQGGSLRNGEFIGNNTSIEASYDQIILKNIELYGDFKNSTYKAAWFGIVKDKENIEKYINKAIINIDRLKGGILEFEAGQYLCSSTVWLKANVGIKGSDFRPKYYYGTNKVYTFFKFRPKDNGCWWCFDVDNYDKDTGERFPCNYLHKKLSGNSMIGTSGFNIKNISITGDTTIDKIPFGALRIYGCTHSYIENIQTTSTKVGMYISSCWNTEFNNINIHSYIHGIVCGCEITTSIFRTIQCVRDKKNINDTYLYLEVTSKDMFMFDEPTLLYRTDLKGESYTFAYGMIAYLSNITMINCVFEIYNVAITASNCEIVNIEPYYEYLDKFVVYTRGGVYNELHPLGAQSYGYTEYEEYSNGWGGKMDLKESFAFRVKIINDSTEVCRIKITPPQVAKRGSIKSYIFNSDYRIKYDFDINTRVYVSNKGVENAFGFSKSDPLSLREALDRIVNNSNYNNVDTIILVEDINDYFTFGTLIDNKKITFKSNTSRFKLSFGAYFADSTITFDNVSFLSSNIPNEGIFNITGKVVCYIRNFISERSLFSKSDNCELVIFQSNRVATNIEPNIVFFPDFQGDKSYTINEFAFKENGVNKSPRSVETYSDLNEYTRTPLGLPKYVKDTKSLVTKHLTESGKAKWVQYIHTPEIYTSDNFIGAYISKPVFEQGTNKAFPYWDTTNTRMIYWNGIRWVNSLGEPDDAKVTGSTSDRPTGVKVGFFYKDTTLNKPIWWDGTNWVDATGATV